jgi:hypothetical protein
MTICRAHTNIREGGGGVAEAAVAAAWGLMKWLHQPEHPPDFEISSRLPPTLLRTPCPALKSIEGNQQLALAPTAPAHLPRELQFERWAWSSINGKYQFEVCISHAAGNKIGEIGDDFGAPSCTAIPCCTAIARAFPHFSALQAVHLSGDCF